MKNPAFRRLFGKIFTTVFLASTVCFILNICPPCLAADSFFLDPDLFHIDPSVLSDMFPSFQYVIDFEDQPYGAEVYNQYSGQGVLFPTMPLVSSPNVQTISGSQAITNQHPGEEFPGAIIVEFTAGQSGVGAYIGSDQNTAGNTLYVYLNAYDNNNQRIQSVGPIEIGAGPSDVTHFIFVSSESENIWKVEFKVFPGYGFYLDDLVFTNLGTQPQASTTAPQVEIQKPSNDHHFYFDSFEYQGGTCGEFGGTIVSENALKKVTIEVTSAATHQTNSLNISFGKIGESRYSFGGFLNICQFLFEGENEVIVRAEDWSGRTGSDDITIEYYPIETKSSLLIITPSEFRPIMVPLAAHKSSSGMPANIITIEAISMDPRFSNSRDLPEKIKKAIAYANQHYDTAYVMLVGDSDKFPVRYCRHLPSEQHFGFGEFYFPADLYYADLYRVQNGTQVFDDWDENGNGYIGEMSNDGATCDEFLIDQVDSLPDVAVGRVPVSNSEELQNYVEKVIRYENDYHPSWFFKTLLLTGDYPGDENTNDWIADNTLSGFTKTKYYFSQHHDDPGYIQQITNLWNSGFGFVSYLGHGGRCQLDSYYVCRYVLDLTNREQLPVVFAAACYTAQFHTLEGKYLSKDGREPPENGWPSPAPEPAALQPENYDVNSCAEHLTVRRPVGAIAYIGSYTGSQGWGLDLAKNFFESYDNLASSSEPVILGDMWNQALINYYYENVLDIATGECLTSGHYSDDGYWIPQTIYHHMRKFMLFGDPSLRLGGSPVPSDIPFIPFSEIRLLTWDIAQYGQQGDRAKLSGQTSQPGTLEVYENTKQIAKFNVGNEFDVTLPSMTEGLHHLNLYLRSQSGEILDKKSVNVFIDLTPPEIKLTSYTPFASSSEIFISGETENLARVELYENNQLIASTIAEPRFANISENQPFTLQIDKELEPGLHYFTLKATDSSGNQSVMDGQIVIQVIGDYFCPQIIEWDSLFNRDVQLPFERD